MANETYGELTHAELVALREAAHPCLRCGMLADIDPVWHAERYGHRPLYRDETGTWEFFPDTMTWVVGNDWWTWTSPNGVDHLVPGDRPCATCGRHHDR